MIDASTSIVHKCPPYGSGLTLCCGKTPYELPTTDIITRDSALVNCGQVFQVGNAYREMLMNVINGSEIHCIGPNWNSVWAGNVEFESQGWRFTIFNDCDEVDYTDNCTSPEGINLTFDMLADNELDPLTYGDDVLYEKIYDALRNASA